MYITIYSFRVRPGKMDAVARLFCEWREILAVWNPHSLELLADSNNPDEMKLVARFTDEDRAWAAVESNRHAAWYSRLVGLAESGPSVEHYRAIEPAASGSFGQALRLDPPEPNI